MKNRCLVGLTVTILLTLSIVTTGAQKNTQAEAMMAAAQQKETVEGDLNAAIKQYKEIVDRYAKTDRRTAAMALIRMAEAYRKMGDVESGRIFAKVMSEYSDQKEAVTLARARLGLEDSPTGPISKTVLTPAPGCCGTLSRDGRFLSYRDRQEGDVFLREIATGRERNITNRPKDSKDLVYESVISPDGKQIAYVWKTQESSRYSIRLANLAGDPNPRVLYEDSDVYDLYLKDWSPDGKSVAVELHRADKVTKQIALLSLSDPSPRVLKSLDWRGINRMQFSPDGNYLGYDRPQSDTSKENDVFVIAVDGSREFPAVVNSSNDVMMSWSPDGKWLLFSSDRSGAIDLWAVAFTDGKPQGEPQRVRPNLGQNFQPVGWTDSGALYYRSWQGGDRNLSMRLASLDWSTARYSSVPIGTRGYQENTSFPTWSPDGKSLAYLSSLRSASNEGPLLAIRAMDSGITREVRPGKLSKIILFEGWSPDGRALWVTANDKGGVQSTLGNGIYRVDPDTGDASAVVRYDEKVPLTGGMTWMPDGLSFLIQALGPNGSTPYRVDAQTGALTLLGPVERASRSLRLSADGSSGYYRQDVSPAGAAAGSLFAFIERNFATDKERELIRRSSLGQPSPSPDGVYIATVTVNPVSNSRVVLLIPTAGSEPRELMGVPSEVKAADLNNRNLGQNVTILQWAADSRSLLVREVPADRTKEIGLWIVPLNGGEPRRVVGDGPIRGNNEMSVSPDGRHFAYTITEPGPPATSEVAVLENFLPKTPKK